MLFSLSGIPVSGVFVFSPLFPCLEYLSLRTLNLFAFFPVWDPDLQRLDFLRFSLSAIYVSAGPGGAGPRGRPWGFVPKSVGPPTPIGPYRPLWALVGPGAVGPGPGSIVPGSARPGLAVPSPNKMIRTSN